METRTEVRSTNGISAQSIADVLRNRIVSGDLAPGAKLPTRLELETEFGASSLTVQRAFDALVRDEFVQTSGRRGTFVAETPPHLSRYALVFRHHPHYDNGEWATLYTALSNCAMAIPGRAQRQVSIFTGVAPHRDNKPFTQLVADVRHQRLAGLIFGDGMTSLVNTPLLCEQMPRVMVTTDYHGPDSAMNGEGAPGTTHLVIVPILDLVSRALEFFAGKNKKRVALLGHTAPDDVIHRHFVQEAGKYGLETRPYWIQCSNIAQRGAAQPLTHLLLQMPKSERPDALLITDDNLVEPATQGVIDALGSRVSEIEIVAHANFPVVTKSLMPAHRLGVDTAQVLEAALDAIDLARRERELPADSNSPFGVATRVAQVAAVLFENQLTTPKPNFGPTSSRAFV